MTFRDGPQSRHHFDAPPPGGSDKGIDFILNQLALLEKHNVVLLRSDGSTFSPQDASIALQTTLSALKQAIATRLDLQGILAQPHGAHSARFRDFLNRALRNAGISSSGNLREACVFALANTLDAEHGDVSMGSAGQSGPVDLNRSSILLPGHISILPGAPATISREEPEISFERDAHRERVVAVLHDETL